MRNCITIAPRSNILSVPWSVCNQQTKADLVEFIKKYATYNGLPVPRVPRGKANTAPTYLPASETFLSVHAAYFGAHLVGQE